jgi:hypothetical protein
MKEFVQFRTFVLSQAMPERFEFATLFLTEVDLAADHRWNQHSEHWPRFPSLVRKIGFNQRPETSDHHFVARTYHDSAVVCMSFEEGRQRRSEEIAAQQCVIHPFGSVSQFLAGRRLGHFERNASIRPNVPDDAANYFPGANIWRVIFTAMHDGNPRVSAHEAVEYLFASRRNPCQSQSFIDDRRNDRYRLSPADQRIAKPIAVHSHKVGAIYNNCTGGSMLNVLNGPY